MSGGGGPPKHKPPGLVLPSTPLSGFMPTVSKLPRQVVNTALGLVGSTLTGLAKSGMVKSAVTRFADSLVIDESLVKVEDLDVPFWSALLATGGYNNPAGFKKFAAAVLPKVAGLDASNLAKLATTFKLVGFYDKELFNALATAVSANFTTLETDEALEILSAFTTFDHYSQELFDDLADSITYTNHYLAPLKISADKVAAGLAAFAKYKHERADLMTTLSRGLSEMALDKLSSAARAEAVGDALRAFNTFKFYPEAVEAVLYVARVHPEDFSPAQLAEAKTAQSGAEEAHGGHLHVYDAATEEHDASHWYTHHTAVKHEYNLYVFRDSLVQPTYVPSSIGGAK